MVTVVVFSPMMSIADQVLSTKFVYDKEDKECKVIPLTGRVVT
jgi:hypothetical protein